MTVPDASMPEANMGPATPSAATEAAPASDEPRAETTPAQPTVLEEENAVTSRGLARAAWLITTSACLIAALITLIDGYHGYAAVTFAVAIAAAINLL